MKNWKKVSSIDYLKEIFGHNSSLFKSGRMANAIACRIFMSQTKYVKKYKKDSIADCKSMTTSSETGMELLPSADTKLVGTRFKW